MFAYGARTERRAAVDLVTGPGNVYVTAAKRLLRGVVGIDAEAGPSEVDGRRRRDRRSRCWSPPTCSARPSTARPAASVLVTDRAALADAVDASSAEQVAATKHVERVAEALAGPQSGTVLVRDLDAGAWRSPTRTAPSTWRSRPPTPAAVARRVRNAGCVFVGAARAGLAGRLRGRLQPRAADRRQLPAHRRPVRADVPARRQPGRVRRGRAGAGSRRHVVALGATPRTCPRTRDAIAAADPSASAVTGL